MTEYTAEEVFAEANRHGDHVADMLTAYADLLERIEADEVAADYPECSGDPSSCPENEGHGCCKPNPPAQAAQMAQGEAVAKVRHFDYRGIARNDFSQEAQMLDGAPVLPDGTLLYTAPPAQPAERASFERWLIGVHGYSPEDLIWQEKRNCYADYGIHLAWQAWQAAQQANR